MKNRAAECGYRKSEQLPMPYRSFHSISPLLFFMNICRLYQIYVPSFLLQKFKIFSKNLLTKYPTCGII